MTPPTVKLTPSFFNTPSSTQQSQQTSQQVQTQQQPNQQQTQSSPTTVTLQNGKVATFAQPPTAADIAEANQLASQQANTTASTNASTTPQTGQFTNNADQTM